MSYATVAKYLFGTSLLAAVFVANQARSAAPEAELECPVVSGGGGIGGDGTIAVLGQFAVGISSTSRFDVESGALPCWTRSGDVPAVPGDCDDDRDLDLDDFSCIAACLEGPDRLPGHSCAQFDLDGDSDVDVRDFQEFVLSFGVASF